MLAQRLEQTWGTCGEKVDDRRGVGVGGGRAAGTLLRGFYNANRIIDGPEDGFIVKIS
ncbi:hypothetical protein ACFVGY_36485 [Streptomyces sp. NPDC127106]|uniref:hypothetical protein n=1 Tax=Streptomyces sp. NPDC127106 TaxID=3345360 RepID=UPI0036295672